MESAEDQEDLPSRRQDKIQAQEQGGFHPTRCSPNPGGCRLGGEMWGRKPIEYFNILCFSVHCHAVIILSHELMC